MAKGKWRPVQLGTRVVQRARSIFLDESAPPEYTQFFKSAHIKNYDRKVNWNKKYFFHEGAQQKLKDARICTFYLFYFAWRKINNFFLSCPQSPKLTSQMSHYYSSQFFFAWSKKHCATGRMLINGRMRTSYNFFVFTKIFKQCSSSSHFQILKQKYTHTNK